MRNIFNLKLNIKLLKKVKKSDKINIKKSNLLLNLNLSSNFLIEINNLKVFITTPQRYLIFLKLYFEI